MSRWILFTCVLCLIEAGTLMAAGIDGHYPSGVAPTSGPGGVDINDCGEETMIVPDEYVYKLVVQPPLAGLGRIVRSDNGGLFFIHGGAGGGVRISELDVHQDRATTVLEIPPWQVLGALVGGPGDSFFIDLDGEIRQVSSDGSFTTWGRNLGALPLVYTHDGRMLAIGPGATSVVELAPDGSMTTLLSGLSLAYDIAATTDGVIYVVDFAAKQLIELSADGGTRVLTAIAPDNTDLALDANNKLYLNSAATGFAQVNRTTGVLTPMQLASAPCHVVQSPADVVFDSHGRAIFAAWAGSRLTWVDFDADTGGVLLHSAWANNTATTLGPDDALYVGVSGCGTPLLSAIARLTVGGASQVYLDGIPGLVDSIDFDESGGLYIAVSSETSVGIYYHDPFSGVLSLVRDSNVYDIDSIAFDATRDRLLAALASPTADEATVRAYDMNGLQSTDTVELPKALLELMTGLAPDGTVYGFGMELDRFFSGPVDHFLLDLDLAAGSSQEVFQHTREGCCPASNFSVDAQGHSWIVLNPDFLLYEVDPDAGATLFACDVPVDSLGVFRTSRGDILLNSPEGMYRIWQPTLAERVELVVDELDLLPYYGVLEPGRHRALAAKLAAAIASLGRGSTAAAANQLTAFVRQTAAFVMAGILTEAQADAMVTRARDVLDRL